MTDPDNIILAHLRKLDAKLAEAMRDVQADLVTLKADMGTVKTDVATLTGRIIRMDSRLDLTEMAQ